jgi:hypothetical protein
MTRARTWDSRSAPERRARTTRSPTSTAYASGTPRSWLGIARTGGAGENTSGDGFLAFSTATRGRLPSGALGEILLAAETMTGRDGVTAHALPHERLRA